MLQLLASRMSGINKSLFYMISSGSNTNSQIFYLWWSFLGRGWSGEPVQFLGLPHQPPQPTTPHQQQDRPDQQKVSFETYRRQRHRKGCLKKCACYGKCLHFILVHNLQRLLGKDFATVCIENLHKFSWTPCIVFRWKLLSQIIQFWRQWFPISPTTVDHVLVVDAWYHHLYVRLLYRI